MLLVATASGENYSLTVHKRKRERKKPFIRSTNKSRSVLRKKYTNQGVIFILRKSSFPKRKTKLKKEVEKVFLSTQVLWKNPPDPNFMKPIIKLGSLPWQTPVALVFEAYTYWSDRGKERGCKAVGKMLRFGSVLVSLLLCLKVSRVESW